MSKEYKAIEYSGECYPYNENMRLQCECHFEAGWEEAMKSLWTIPDKIEKIPIYKNIKERGFIALLKNREIVYQKTLNNFYWNDKKFVYGYTEVLAWMNVPEFDKILENNKDVLKRLKDK